ncbi:glycosyltransferase [Phreatobacter sp.]|uniref:glycosyltransferase n=1 Tax=Phreatobacter sp. TaxID=1966341 RepID=UPI003F6F0257
MQGEGEPGGIRQPAGALRPASRLPPVERRARVANPTPSRRRLIDDLLDRRAVLRAELAAERWGVTPVEAALALGLTSHAALGTALAKRLSATFLPDGPGEPVLAGDAADWRSILERGHIGIVRPVGGLAYCVAARPADAERLAAAGHRLAGHGLPLVVMPAEAFAAMIRRWTGPRWLAGALDGLRGEEPDRSAADRDLMTRTALVATTLLGLLALVLVAAPAPLALVGGGLVGLAVIGWSAIRLVAAALPARPLPRHRLTDRDLPRYAILCALYREEAVAAQLVGALHRIAYPRAKLDILILTEADDDATRNAIAAANPDPAIRVITLPPGGPATKPRALALGLPLARGDLVVVYDAEDRPHPGQLREAAETFAVADDRLGCLQAPLAIVNSRDSLLTRLFTAEYDALFRVLLPGLARLGWPMPLGGTSNHFRGIR